MSGGVSFSICKVPFKCFIRALYAAQRATSVNPHMTGEKSEQVPWAAVTMVAMMVSSLPPPLMLLFEIGFHVCQTGLKLTM